MTHHHYWSHYRYPNNKKLISYDQWEHHTTNANAVDHLTQKFPGGPLNSRRYPGFPGGFLNSSRFPGFPGVVDTLYYDSSLARHDQLIKGITSGWNCCSVRVCELPQFSPASHADNSPHSSSGFTSEHGVDLTLQKIFIQWSSHHS